MRTKKRELLTRGKNQYNFVVNQKHGVEEFGGYNEDFWLGQLPNGDV